ncbi:MAG: carboxypeptidase regulatory-like domain-containing protein, partial [Bacteroidota bacterium]
FGGRQDWIYWWCGGRETTVELWNTKNPPGSVLPQRWTNNRESFLAYMEQALKGVRGIVSDAETNAPLRARIGVQGIPNVPVFSDSSVGDYHRLLLPGTYTLVAQATGYHPDTVRNVVVVDSVATRVDVALQRRTTSIEQVDVPSTFSLSQNYPNPFNPTTKILYSLPPGVGTLHVTSLRVHDVLGREVATLVNEELKAGDYEVTFDGHGLSSGVYFYRLQSGNITATMKLLLLR